MTTERKDAVTRALELRAWCTDGERMLFEQYLAHLAEGGATAWQIDALVDVRVKTAVLLAAKEERQQQRRKQRLDRRRSRRDIGELPDPKAQRTEKRAGP